MAFEPAATLIGLREGMEIFLVLGILLGILSRLGHSRQGWVVWAGFAAGALLAAVAGVVILGTLEAWFETRGGAEAFEIVVALAAISVLTWMVLWMQRHARTLTQEVKASADKAVATGNWFALGFLAFITVIREGLEIVLFYGALAANAPWSDLIWSGLVGFAVSAVLAFALFGAIMRVDVRRFFAVSGFLLILIAAGLIVHVIHAVMELGWIPHGAPLWDTSGVLPDEDHWLGGPLHALVGYEDQPTMLQLLAYVSYILGVGGWYAVRLADGTRRNKVRTGAIAAAILLLGVFALGGALGLGADAPHEEDAAAGHNAHTDHQTILGPGIAALQQYDGRVGVLIRQHGEWIEYNASTYESVRQFIIDIWPYTGLPAELLTVDDGSYFVDAGHPFSHEIHTDARLVDPWLAPWELAALPIADPAGASDLDDELAGGPVRFVPGAGPGLGEGDIFELAGIGAYRTWLKMDNHSPLHSHITVAWDYLTTHLAKHYGDKVVPAFAFHIDPKVSPDETLHAAAKRLAAADVDVVFDVYMSSIHSDAMNGCMMAPHATHALRHAGFDGPIVPVAPAGHHPAWAEAIADEVQRLVTERGKTTPLSIHLSQHGATPGSESPCRPVPDPYHAQADEQFALAHAAIRARLGPDAPTITLRHVYGQGADGAADGTLSPKEALAADNAAGIGDAIIIPYEFWGDAMDNLVNLRESLGKSPDAGPYYNADHETTGTWKGVSWRVVSATFGTDTKATALLAQLDAAMASHLAQNAD